MTVIVHVMDEVGENIDRHPVLADPVSQRPKALGRDQSKVRICEQSCCGYIVIRGRSPTVRA